MNVAQRRFWGFFLLSTIILAGWGCTEEYVPFPRPYAFPRLELPTQVGYQTFDNESCPFTFEYPEGARIERNRADSCWVDITFPDYDCTWHLNSRNIPGSGRPLAVHQEEHRRLIFNHAIKASRIEPEPIEYPAGSGVKYQVSGNVATPTQIFFHDSLGQEAMTFSFYYQTALKNDSLAPVTDFMRAQVEHMLQTFRWK